VDAFTRYMSYTLKRSPSDREKAINIEHNDKMTTTPLLDHIQNYIEFVMRMLLTDTIENFVSHSTLIN
jgi:hypothetical protein